MLSTSMPPPTGPDDARLDRALRELDLPTRMLNFAEGRGWSTLRDLLSVHPAGFTTERNIGRKTLQETAEAITQALGASWEDAWALTADPSARVALQAELDATSPRARWRRLARTDAIAELDLGALALPARMRNFVAQQNIRSVPDLLALSWDGLLDTKNLGRGSLNDSVAVIEAALETLGEPDPLAGVAHWREALTLLIGTLSTQQRLVLASRAGLNGPPQTLLEVGQILGFTRERARQLEVASIESLTRRTRPLPWRGDLETRTPKPWIRWSALGDTFWSVEPEDLPALQIFLEVLDTDVRGAKLEGVLIATRLQNAQLDSLRERAEAVPETLVYPFPHVELRERFAAALGAWSEYTEALLELIADEWQVDADTVTGYGSRRADEVRALLRSRGTPVHRSEVDRISRAWPSDLVVVDRGMVTLRELMPAWHSWVERVGLLAEELIRENDAERQWSSFELLPLMAERAQLPPWINPHSLGALLKESTRVRYLGRNAVTLAAEVKERTYLAPTLEAILEQAGGPMKEDDARAALQQERHVGELAWFGVVRRAPFVMLQGDRIGLAPRDVSGGEPAMERLVAELAAGLRRDGVAWSRGQLEQLLRDLGQPQQAWEDSLARSVIRNSGLFRLAKGRSGYIGLAEWPEVRGPSQLDTLLALVDEGGGTCSAALAFERLPSASGDPVSRTTLLSLCSRAGLSLRGDTIRRREPRVALLSLSESLETWLASLPEETADHARELLGNDDGEPLEPKLETWEARLREAAATHPAIEVTQVARLATSARGLLGHPREGEGQRIARAAVRYLLSEEDARSDLIVGGLDDDEGVLAATWELLGLEARG